MQCRRVFFHTRIFTLGSFTVAMACAVSPSWAETSQTFAPPTHNNYRVDVCATWAQGCGEPAATQFCKLKGFDKAQSWSIAKDIGAATPTLVIGDNKVCGQATCDGFASVTCTKASSARNGTRQSVASPAGGPIAAMRNRAMQNKLHLTIPPAPGPSTQVEFGFPYQSAFDVTMENIDIYNSSLVLNRLKNPVVQVRFKAAADTHYAVECATQAMSNPASLGYTLDWWSDNQSEKVPGAQAETLLMDNKNIGWIFAAIPQHSLSRWITVQARGFTSSRSIFLCRLTPYK